MLGKLCIHMQKKETGPYHILYRKTNSKLSVKHKAWNSKTTIRKLEENASCQCFSWACFFLNNTKSRGYNSKNRQIGLHQIKKLLQRKANNKENEKVSYRVEENNLQIIYLMRGCMHAKSLQSCPHSFFFFFENMYHEVL